MIETIKYTERDHSFMAKNNVKENFETVKKISRGEREKQQERGKKTKERKTERERIEKPC